MHGPIEKIYGSIFVPFVGLVVRYDLRTAKGLKKSEELVHHEAREERRKMKGG